MSGSEGGDSVSDTTADNPASSDPETDHAYLVGSLQSDPEA
jgi:hypothetical protein